MSDDRLHSGIKDHYRGKSLRSDMMERLIAQAETLDAQSPETAETPVTPISTPAPRRRDWLSMTAVAAAAAALMIAGGVHVMSSEDPAASERRVAVAGEIALNHNKQLAVEFRAPSYPELANHMVKLDFAPARPSPTKTDADLLGARYCSIQKSIAAQIKLVDDGGAIHTLYQARWSGDFDGLPGNTVDVDGVRVKFWRESDVLFGLASTSR